MIERPTKKGKKPEYVSALEASYGPPSQEGFGSAVFFENVRKEDELEGVALDWEAIRESYLPAVQRADEEEDLVAYYAVLNEMAVSIQDAHVVAIAPSSIQSAYFTETGETVAASLGAQLVELDDGRFIITFLDPEGPGAQEGWQFGTEIISVDGLPTGEYVASLPIYSSLGTEESVRLSRLSNALRYPEGSTTTIEYILPGESEVRSATLTPAVGFDFTPPSTTDDQEITFRTLENGEGYIRWDAFNNLRYKVTVLEHALEQLQNTPGIVLDLRGNAGGNQGLYLTMASCFFTADEPAIRHWLDWYEYDETVGNLVKQFSTDYVLSTPRPDLAYTNPLVILVDQESTSAGEYFPQYLQTLGRAIIVGEHSTAGAGGPVDRVSLPGGLSFQFTKGRTVFAGTDELNLEGKGNTLDVEVPVTEENERAKLEGRDVVLEAGLEALAQQGIAAITNRTWQWTSLADASGNQQEVDDLALYTITINEEGTVAIQSDCNVVNGTYSLEPTEGAQFLKEATIPGTPLTFDLGPATTAACEEGSRSDEFLQFLSTAFYFQIIDGQLGVFTGFDPDTFRSTVLLFEVDGFRPAFLAAFFIALAWLFANWLWNLIGYTPAAGITGAITHLILTAAFLYGIRNSVSGLKVNGFSGALIAAAAIALITWVASLTLAAVVSA